MKILFDIDKIESLITHFYQLTDLVVTFCDSDFTHITSSKQLSGFCALIRKNHCSRCEACDFNGLFEAKRSGKLYSYTCHAGLIESIIPIFYNDIIIGFIMIGEYRDAAKQNSSIEQVLRLTKGYNLNQEELLTEYEKLPILTTEQLESMFEIFKSFITLMWKENLIKSQDFSLFTQISSFIDTNLKEPISVKTLCEKFYLSKNSLYKLVEGNAGMTPNKLILFKKLNLAKQLLYGTNLNISQVAEECGFSSQNYFIRAFKQNFGLSPLQYKKYYFDSRENNA